MIAVHGIFIERLLNQKWNLSRHNIHREKTNLRNAMNYFTTWISEKAIVQVQSNINATEADKFYMAHKTYQNLILTVAGFVGYSEAILNYSTQEKFVPMLHSNQSSIEGFFRT